MKWAEMIMLPRTESAILGSIKLSMVFQCKFWFLHVQYELRFDCIYLLDFLNDSNPIGRTGLRGRGLLGKWGPNHAADFILTRWLRNEMNGQQIMNEDSQKPILQFLAIERLRGNEWAIPGVSVASLLLILELKIIKTSLILINYLCVLLN